MGSGTREIRYALAAVACAMLVLIPGCGSPRDERDGNATPSAPRPPSPSGEAGSTTPRYHMVSPTNAPARVELGAAGKDPLGGILDRVGVPGRPTGQDAPELSFVYAQQASDWQFQQTGTPVVEGGTNDLRLSNLMSNRAVNVTLDRTSGVSAQAGVTLREQTQLNTNTDSSSEKQANPRTSSTTQGEPNPKTGSPSDPPAAAPGQGPVSKVAESTPRGNAAPAAPGTSTASGDLKKETPTSRPETFDKSKAPSSPSDTGGSPVISQNEIGHPQAGGTEGGRDLPTAADRQKRDSDAPVTVPVGERHQAQFERDAVRQGSVMPRFDEELWIIASMPAPDKGRGEAIPTTGSLLAKPVSGGAEVPLWIESTRVAGVIDGLAASLTFEQRFRNTLDAPADVVYAFPLPADASVTDFVMSVGARKIRGVIRERDEAQRLFAEATRQGYRASLVLQDRPSLFTQRLSNVPGSAVVETSISYVQPLRASGGSFVLELPTSTAGARSPALDGYGPTLDLSITERSALALVQSPTHSLDAARDSQGAWRVSLSDGSAKSAGNLRLRLTPEGKGTLTRLLGEPSQDGSIFALAIVAPDDFSTSSRSPADVLLVIDAGLEPRALERAKLTALIALSRLTPVDRVRVVAARADGISSDRPALESATVDVVRNAAAFVQGIISAPARGKLAPALTQRWADGTAQRVVITMTSGGGDTESDLFLAARSMPKGTRVLSLGLGDAAHRRVIDGLARVSGGAAAYLAPADEPADAIDPFLETALRPSLRGLWVDWNGADVVDVYPRQIPDVLPGKPVVIYGVLRGASPPFVTVHGAAETASAQIRVPWPAPAGANRPGAISTLWAKQKLLQLSEDLALDPYNSELKAAMIRLARLHNLVSPFTSFVVVDATEPLARD